MLIAVTDHAADRFRQRVGGSLDPKADIVDRVSRAYAAGRTEEAEEDGRGDVRVRDLKERDVVFVCRRSGGELLVVTLWEEERLGPARVTQRWTNIADRGR